MFGHNKMKEAWTHTAQMWYDELENLLTIRITKNANITINDVKNHFEVVQRLVGDKKPLVLSDIRSSYTISNEARKYAAFQSSNRKATAIVTNKFISRMFANLYIYLNRPQSPTRLFNSEAAARAWLKSIK